MPIRQAKVYSDGSHFIAIPPENFSGGKHKKQPSKATTQDNRKQAFEIAYKESQSLPRKERKAYIAEQLQNEFETAEQTKEYVKQQYERKRNNSAKRYTRLWRKVNLQCEWNYFVTFTYSDDKHTEETFKTTLRNTLKHIVYRKGWKYIGVWERSVTERLHFHGIFYIPENAMVGRLEQVKDYSTKQHRMQTTYQNTHFLKHFGRNDFKEIEKQEIKQSVRYLLKYIEKSGERLVFGGDLPTYIVGNIADDDVICPIGVDDKKMLLFDDFTCIDEDGVVMGKATPEVIRQMPKAN